MTKGLIVFLNGTSSSGKTTISDHLIHSSPVKFMHLSVDEVLKSHVQLVNDKISEYGEVNEENIHKLESIIINPLAALYHSLIKGYSEIGIHVIVDHVAGSNKEWLLECVNLLCDHPVIFVGVKCSLDELERREKLRGDRQIGLARWQYDSIHSFENYDIEVNTDELSPQQCADLIIEKINHMTEYKAFQTLKNIIEG